VKGRAKAKSHDKTKNRGSPSSFARHHEVKPEEVFLEEETPTEPSTDKEAASDRSPSDSEASPAAASAPGGPAAHVSLETTGYMDSDHVNVISPSITGGIADDVGLVRERTLFGRRRERRVRRHRLDRVSALD